MGKKGNILVLDVKQELLFFKLNWFTLLRFLLEYIFSTITSDALYYIYVCVNYFKQFNKG